MSRQVYQLTNDYYSLSAEWKVSILTAVVKMFLEKDKSIPQRLLKDLKKAKKDNKSGTGFEIHKDVKETKEAVYVYYRQYKHLEKYYPKDLKFCQHASLQRGARAVNIGKKYERLIRLKGDDKIWRYDDDNDGLHWINKDVFKHIKKQIKKGEIKKSEIGKEDIEIGDVKWYAITMCEENSMYNFGIMALTDMFLVQGEYLVFDTEENRDTIYNWIMA